MFEGFLNPALAAGAALCAVPLLIHILNRQRHRPLAWGAMRFVLAAHRRTRRRTQLENLLLLFLRMGVVVLLALALARPFTDGIGPLVGLTETRRDVVLVIDASASTGYRENTVTVYERLVDRAREILLELDAERGDRVRLYLGRSYAEPLSQSSPDEALALLSVLSEPTFETFDFAAMLAEVVRLAEEDAAGTGASALEVRLLSDLQRVSFMGRGLEDTHAAGDTAQVDDTRARAAGGSAPAEPERADALVHLDRLAELGVQVVVEDLGPAAMLPANLGVTDVGALGPVFGAGSVVDVGVEISNRGPAPVNGVRVALSVDGVRQPIRIVDIPARDRARAVFSVTFREAGERVLVAELEGDRLHFDDRRAHVLLVPPPIEVLLVGGSPGAAFEEDELAYVRAVLAPPGDSLSDLWGDQPGGQAGLPGGTAPPFHTREIRASELDSPAARLEQADVILLANVPSISQGATLALEERVAAGAALIIALGDRVDREAYNARLWRADGSGLLPAQLGRRSATLDRRESWFRMSSFEQDHPALAFFADERWRPLLTEVPVYEFIRATPLPDTRVLIRYDDEGTSPALLERTYDRGVVLLFTSTLDADWTRLPESPRTLIPLLHELLRNAVNPVARTPNLGLAGPLIAETTSFPRQPELVSPAGARRPLDGEPESLGGGLWRLPAEEGPFEPGIWRVEFESGRHTLEFAVRAPVLEGDLARAGAREVDGLHPALVVTGPEAKADTESAGTPRGELWRLLAGLCLAFLVAETLWAAWLGHGRRRLST